MSCRKHPRLKTWKARSLSQSALKCPIKVTRKQMWFDLIIAGIPPAKRDLATQHCVWQPVGNLKPEQQLRPAPPAPTISDALPAPMKASGIQSCSGWVPPCSWVNFDFTQEASEVVTSPDSRSGKMSCCKELTVTFCTLPYRIFQFDKNLEH